MKPVLFLVGALALAASPALTQTPAPAPSPPPSSYTPPGFNDLSNSPYVGTTFRRCLSVGPVSGANRSGAKKVYVRDRKGEVFRFDLADACEALDAAEALSVRAGRSLDVCVGDSAIMVVKTAAGAKQCAIREVIRPSKAEVTKLAATTQR